ncbi:golgin subfamily A member 2-like [Perognathus longimembris pacificus]|uniref:golgin subfamily A member 2-like n=1 Tax=Perognathus longimembris pacificus TaxID=214514 RepID=UPI0020196518|nr:golgin subfamily A member 2-like [Perognathus longimembris pacificus]
MSLGMWPPHLRQPSAESEQKRQKILAAGRKLLQVCQQESSSSVPAKSKSKNKMKEGGNPKTNTAGDSTLPKGAAKNHGDPEPPPPLSTVRAAGVQSAIGPNNTDGMERHCQRLMLALHYSTRHNQQLYSELQQLKREKKDLQAQQGKEDEKKACVFKAAKADLEQHRLSIQMLTSENPSFQSALAPTQRVANESALEPEALTRYLQAAQQRVTELELQVSAVSTMQKETENNNTELMKALNLVQLQLQDKARSYEDLEDKNTKLHKRLKVLLTQKAYMRSRILRGQEALVEREELQRQLKHMTELVTALTVERDTFAEALRAESSAGKEKVQQLSEQVSRLREEREEGERRVRELENNLVELRAQLAGLQPPQPPTGPSEAEQQLQAQALQLQKELKSLQEQLRGQLEENQSLGLQNLEQRQRLGVLEKKAEAWDQHAEARLKRKAQEQETQRRRLELNRELQEEWAELQDAAQRLRAEKEELARLLRATQRGKTSLREKLRELVEEEEGAGGEEKAELQSQAAEALQELRDECLAQVQGATATREQHRASRRPPTSEQEALQQHLRTQRPLLEPLTPAQGRPERRAPGAREKVQDATRRDNARLRAQLSALAFASQGGGPSQEGDEGEEAPPPAGTAPEDGDNPPGVWGVPVEAPSAAERRKARLQARQARGGGPSQRAAQCPSAPERQAAPERGLQGLLGGWKRETPAPRKNLRGGLPEDLAGDKADAQRPVEDLQPRGSQPSRHRAAVEDTVVGYKEQRSVLEKRRQEKDESEGKRRRRRSRRSRRCAPQARARRARPLPPRSPPTPRAPSRRKSRRSSKSSKPCILTKSWGLALQRLRRPGPCGTPPRSPLGCCSLPSRPPKSPQAWGRDPASLSSTRLVERTHWE